MAHKNSKDETLICFIKATQELIASGDQKLSARKISERAGFHNSMIFFYFKDLEHLISLACIEYLEPYNNALAQINTHTPAAYTEFYMIWYVFCEHAFARPEIFKRLFFGKHSKNLAELFDEYYRLFPEQKRSYDLTVNRMYSAKTFTQRCLSILEPLINHPCTRLTEKNILLANQIIMNNFECFLEKICQKKDVNIHKTIISFHEILHYIIDKKD